MSEGPQPPLVTRIEPPAPASQKPRPGFWEAVLWCVVFLAVQTLGAIIAGAVVLAVLALQTPNPVQFVHDQLDGLAAAITPTPPNAPPRPPVPTGIGQALAYGMLAAQLFSLALIRFVFPRRIGPDWKRQLGVRRPAAMHVLLVVLVVPAFIILSGGIHELIVRITGLEPSAATQAMNSNFRTVPLLVTFLAVAIGPGLVEELWCRGFLGRGLCSRYGFLGGVALTSLFFGFLHIHPAHALVAALMGAYLHFVYLASRSIWVPMLLHMLNNGLGILIALTPVLSDADDRFQKDEKGFRAVIEIAALALMVFASVALWTSRPEVIPTKSKVDDEEPDWLPGSKADWQPEYPGISAPPPEAPAKLSYRPISSVAVVLAFASFLVLAFLLSKL